MGAVFEVRDNQGTPLIFTDQDTTIRLIAGRQHTLSARTRRTFTHYDSRIAPGQVFLVGGMGNFPDRSADARGMVYNADLEDNWTVEDGKVTYEVFNASGSRTNTILVYIYSRT